MPHRMAMVSVSRSALKVAPGETPSYNLWCLSRGGHNRRGTWVGAGRCRRGRVRATCARPRHLGAISVRSFGTSGRANLNALPFAVETRTDRVEHRSHVTALNALQHRP